MYSSPRFRRPNAYWHAGLPWSTLSLRSISLVGYWNPHNWTKGEKEDSVAEGTLPVPEGKLPRIAVAVVSPWPG